MGTPLLQSLFRHKAAINDLSWRVDSNVLASGSEDGTIKLWEMDGGKEIKNIAAHGGGVTSIEMARDGKIVSTGRDRLTKLWDPNGAAIKEFTAFGDMAMEVAITHDSGRVVAGDWLGEVRMSNAADGALIAPLAANPPTLQMRLEAQMAAVAAATAAAQKTAAELAAAQAALDDKAKAHKANADAQAAAQAALESLAAEKAAFDKTQNVQASNGK